MKYKVMDCMDKWEWYTRAELQRLSGVTREKLNVVIDELMDDGFLVEQADGTIRKFGLAITRSRSSLPQVRRLSESALLAREPVAGMPYRPEWKPLLGHDVLNHWRLCEESR